MVHRQLTFVYQHSLSFKYKIKQFNTYVKMLSRKQRTIKAEVKMGPLCVEAVSESNDIFAFMG